MNAAGQDAGLRIKQREAFYCNVKLLLIFMVVYGHMIEGMIDSVEPLMQIYRVIYSVHMPLFLFLSGLFLKSRMACLRQVRQMLLYYGASQTTMVIVGRITEEHCSFTMPVWHLWYLFSLGCMAGLGWCWYAAMEHWRWLNNGAVKAVLLILAVWLACKAGEWSFVGRWLSLSRTICFLPYFLAGMFCPAGVDFKGHIARISGLAGLVMYVLLYLGPGRVVPTKLFYQADSYAVLGITHGPLLRLISMMLAVSLGIGLLAFLPGRRFPFSRLGSDTLAIYLLHAPLIKLLEKINLPIPIRIVLSPLLAGYMIYFFYKLFQWRRQMYSLLSLKSERPGKRLKLI